MYRMVRMLLLVVVFCVLIIPLPTDALDYYFLGLNHGHRMDGVMQWGTQQMELQKNRMLQHNPNSTAINTNLLRWNDSASFNKYVFDHMEIAASQNRAFYISLNGHGSPANVRNINPTTHSGGGMWSGIPVGRANFLNTLNENGKRLGIPVHVIDHSCGSGACSTAAKHYINRDSPFGLQSVFSAGHTPTSGITPSVTRSLWGGSIRGVADLWQNLDRLDTDGKGYLTLGEAINYLRPRTGHHTRYQADGAEGLDTPFIGKECLIGGPQDVCVVVAPGWAAKDQRGNVVQNSIPEGSDEYGICNSPPLIGADCPHFGHVFNTSQPDSPNYKLYHDTRVNGRELTLRKQYEDQKSIARRQLQERFKERADEAKILFVIPSKEQAWEYVNSGFERYNVGGVSVKPGLYPINRAMNIHPNAESDKDAWEGVRAKESGDTCVFETAAKPPPPPELDPSLGDGPGGPGTGSGTENAIMSLLGELLSSLFNQQQGPEGPPEQDPDQDLSDVDEMPDHIVGCPEKFNPVCAFDGRTYFNECVAEMEAKPVAHMGFCGSPIPEEVVREIPPSLLEQVLNAVWSFIQGSGVTERTEIP